MEKRFLEKFLYDKEKYHLLIIYFAYMLNSDFIVKLTDMSEERDYTNGHVGYMFANNCDEEDIKNGDDFENGVLFFFGNEVFDEIIVDYSIFYYSLKAACEVYLEDNPEDKDIVEEKLEIIRKRYHL